MTDWYIREPSGEVSDDYPFDDSFKKYLKEKKVFVIAVSQEQGMRPEAIGIKLSHVLMALNERIKGYRSQHYTVIIDREKKSYERFSDFADVLKGEASKIETPWYWDGVKGLIESREASLLIQAETDGMDIAIYIAGDDAEQLSLTLQEALASK